MNKGKHILILLCIVVMLLSTDLFVNLNDESKEHKSVENYCAVTYSTNAQEYKQCTKLKSTEILEKLTKEAQTKYDVPKLPEIKGLK